MTDMFKALIQTSVQWFISEVVATVPSSELKKIGVESVTKGAVAGALPTIKRDIKKYDESSYYRYFLTIFINEFGSSYDEIITSFLVYDPITEDTLHNCMEFVIMYIFFNILYYRVVIESEDPDAIPIYPVETLYQIAQGTLTPQAAFEAYSETIFSGILFRNFQELYGDDHMFVHAEEDALKPIIESNMAQREIKNADKYTKLKKIIMAILPNLKHMATIIEDSPTDENILVTNLVDIILKKESLSVAVQKYMSSEFYKEYSLRYKYTKRVLDPHLTKILQEDTAHTLFTQVNTVSQQLYKSQIFYDAETVSIELDLSAGVIDPSNSNLLEITTLTMAHPLDALEQKLGKSATIGILAAGGFIFGGPVGAAAGALYANYALNPNDANVLYSKEIHPSILEAPYVAASITTSAPSATDPNTQLDSSYNPSDQLQTQITIEYKEDSLTFEAIQTFFKTIQTSISDLKAAIGDTTDNNTSASSAFLTFLQTTFFSETSGSSSSTILLQSLTAQLITFLNTMTKLSNEKSTHATTPDEYKQLFLEMSVASHFSYFLFTIFKILHASIIDLTDVSSNLFDQQLDYFQEYLKLERSISTQIQTISTLQDSQALLYEQIKQDAHLRAIHPLTGLDEFLNLIIKSLDEAVGKTYKNKPTLSVSSLSKSLYGFYRYLSVSTSTTSNYTVYAYTDNNFKNFKFNIYNYSTDPNDNYMILELIDPHNSDDVIEFKFTPSSNNPFEIILHGEYLNNGAPLYVTDFSTDIETALGYTTLNLTQTLIATELTSQFLSLMDEIYTFFVYASTHIMSSPFRTLFAAVDQVQQHFDINNYFIGQSNIVQNKDSSENVLYSRTVLDTGVPYLVSVEQVLNLHAHIDSSGLQISLGDSEYEAVFTDNAVQVDPISTYSQNALIIPTIEFDVSLTPNENTVGIESVPLEQVTITFSQYNHSFSFYLGKTRSQKVETETAKLETYDFSQQMQTLRLLFVELYIAGHPLFQSNADIASAQLVDTAEQNLNSLDYEKEIDALVNEDLITNDEGIRALQLELIADTINPQELEKEFPQYETLTKTETYESDLSVLRAVNTLITDESSLDSLIDIDYGDATGPITILQVLNGGTGCILTDASGKQDPSGAILSAIFNLTTIDGSGGSGGQVTLTFLNGSVDTVKIQNGGNGYSNNEQLTMSPTVVYPDNLDFSYTTLPKFIIALISPDYIFLEERASKFTDSSQGSIINAVFDEAEILTLTMSGGTDQQELLAFFNVSTNTNLIAAEHSTIFTYFYTLDKDELKESGKMMTFDSMDLAVAGVSPVTLTFATESQEDVKFLRTIEIMELLLELYILDPVTAFALVMDSSNQALIADAEVPVNTIADLLNGTSAQLETINIAIAMELQEILYMMTRILIFSQTVLIADELPRDFNNTVIFNLDSQGLSDEVIVSEVMGVVVFIIAIVVIVTNPYLWVLIPLIIVGLVATYGIWYAVSPSGANKFGQDVIQDFETFIPGLNTKDMFTFTVLLQQLADVNWHSGHTYLDLFIILMSVVAMGFLFALIGPLLEFLIGAALSAAGIEGVAAVAEAVGDTAAGEAIETTVEAAAETDVEETEAVIQEEAQVEKTAVEEDVTTDIEKETTDLKANPPTNYKSVGVKILKIVLKNGITALVRTGAIEGFKAELLELLNDDPDPSASTAFLRNVFTKSGRISDGGGVHLTTKGFERTLFMQSILEFMTAIAENVDFKALYDGLSEESIAMIKKQLPMIAMRMNGMLSTLIFNNNNNSPENSNGVDNNLLIQVLLLLILGSLQINRLFIHARTQTLTQYGHDAAQTHGLIPRLVQSMENVLKTDAQRKRNAAQQKLSAVDTYIEEQVGQRFKKSSFIKDNRQFLDTLGSKVKQMFGGGTRKTFADLLQERDDLLRTEKENVLDLLKRTKEQLRLEMTGQGESESVFRKLVQDVNSHSLLEAIYEELRNGDETDRELYDQLQDDLDEFLGTFSSREPAVEIDSHLESLLEEVREPLPRGAIFEIDPHLQSDIEQFQSRDAFSFSPTDGLYDLFKSIRKKYGAKKLKKIPVLKKVLALMYKKDPQFVKLLLDPKTTDQQLAKYGDSLLIDRNDIQEVVRQNAASGRNAMIEDDSYLEADLQDFQRDALFQEPRTDLEQFALFVEQREPVVLDDQLRADLQEIFEEFYHAEDGTQS